MEIAKILTPFILSLNFITILILVQCIANSRYLETSVIVDCRGVYDIMMTRYVIFIIVRLFFAIVCRLIRVSLKSFLQTKYIVIS